MAERSVKVKLDLDNTKYNAGMHASSAATRDLEKAARDLRKAHNNAEDAAGSLREAEARLTDVNSNANATLSQRVAAQENLSRALRRNQMAQDDLTAATKRHQAAQQAAANESTRSSKKVDDEMGRLAKRTNTQFDLMKFTGLSVGLPAAAAVGAVGVTAALGVASLAFAGLAVAGVKNTDEVQRAVGGLKDKVVGDVEAMASPLRYDVVGAIDGLGAAWTRLGPQINTAMQGSAPAIRELSGAATDLAEGAMPGLVAAVRESQPVLQGVRTFAGQAGAGLGEFFSNASRGSEGARQGFTVFGGTVQTLEGRLGTLFANLANGSAGPLRSLDVMVDQLSAGLVDLTAGGSGAVGALQGFTTAGSGAVTVLHGVLTAVSALPPQVTQMVGTFGAASMIAGKFGVDAGKGFEGLGAKIKAAEGAGGKFKATMNGLAGGILSPAALATAGLGLALWGFGSAAEKAAARTSEYRENVRSLTQAIREDRGAVSEATAVANMHALTQKNAAANIGVAGIAFATATVAANGNASAMRAVTEQSDAWIQSVAAKAGVGQKDIEVAKSMNRMLLEQGGSYDQLNPLLQQNGKSQEQVTEANRSMSAVLGKLGPQQAGQLVALLNGTGAVGQQAKATRDAYAAYLLQEQGLTDLTEAQIKARDATTEHTQAMYDQVNAGLGLRGAVQTTKEAMDAYNKIAREGKLGTDDGVRATLALENAMQQQIATAGKSAAAAAQGKSENEKLAISTAAMNAEAVKLAGSFSGPLPASLVQTIQGMNATQAQAAGLKLGVNNLGQAVYMLPNGKQIIITSTADQEAARMANLRDKINSLPTHHYTAIDIVTTYKTVGTAAVRTGNNAPDVYLYGPHSAAGGLIGNSPIRKFAAGGMVDITGGGLLRGPGTGTSDSIIGMSSRGPGAFSNGEFVEPASRVTPTTLPILEAIRNGRLHGYANGGMVQAEDGSWVPSSFYGPAPKGPHAMYTDSGFAKLRAAATANGIGSLSAMDQNQLRTYGGWTDQPVSAVSRAISSGLVARGGGGYNGRNVVINQTFNIPNYVGSTQDLIRTIRDQVRVQGGNVQQVFGARR